MIHISRMSEELIYWMNTNFAYIMLPDRFTTGSSIMPQKRIRTFRKLPAASPDAWSVT